MTDFQKQIINTLGLSVNEQRSLTSLAWKLKSNRLAVSSALRGLIKDGLVCTFASDNSMYAVRIVSLTDKGRAHGYQEVNGNG